MKLIAVLLFLMIACKSNTTKELDTNNLDLIDIPNYSKVLEVKESYSTNVACTDSVTTLNVYKVRTDTDTLYVLEPCIEMYWTPRRIKKTDKPLWLLNDGPPPGHRFRISSNAKIPDSVKCAFGTIKTLTR